MVVMTTGRELASWQSPSEACGSNAIVKACVPGRIGAFITMSPLSFAFPSNVARTPAVAAQSGAVTTTGKPTRSHSAEHDTLTFSTTLAPTATSVATGSLNAIVV